ncbi:alpha-ribazole phosphatase [Sediminitomix flava]|uniref:Alpha-ribazole phosphatase n=1 Tax=Sediminitomix flava TaxID=379075 RepID=A0A315ZEH4_SEDFL|nr:alpha-ribazole phosphatase [Sediminitomix flava]PWJ43732.1 alpha-ribazole phosphatase [Sediminitomix flava]
MNIYLIRHTQPKIDAGICYGQADIPLPDDAPQSFKKVISKIGVVPQHIYTSPLVRCEQLAEAILEKTSYQNPSFFTDKRLMEMDFGDWENVAWDDIPEDTLSKWSEDFVNEKVPNGESFVELNKRVLSFWDELLTKKAEHAVVVTHAGVIRALLSNAMNLDLKYAFRLGIDYGGVSCIEVKSPEMVLVRYMNR